MYIWLWKSIKGDGLLPVFIYLIIHKVINNRYTNNILVWKKGLLTYPHPITIYYYYLLIKLLSNIPVENC